MNFKGLTRDVRLLSSCEFEGLSVISACGSAICSIGTNLTIHESFFINNAAGDSGGAIYATKSSLLLNETFYHGNSALRYGGAICCLQSQVDMIGNNTFHNNSCQNTGGAMHFFLSQLNIMYGIAHFHFSEAGYNGGAISLLYSCTVFSGSVTICMLKNKAAQYGGALNIGYKSNISNVKQLTLLDNTAGYEGGAMYVENSNVSLGGNVTIQRNTANMGGGIRADESHICVTGDCILAWNNATFGGAMSTLNGMVYLQGPTQFTHNTAVKDGGAMLAEGTEVQILFQVNFDFNSANNGSAMFFQKRASITFSYRNHGPVLITSFNSVRELGGVIYYRDSSTISQCSYSLYRADDNTLPNCFLQFQHYSRRGPAIIVSRNDSAEREGNFMFGGLLDRCKFLDFYSHDIGDAISIYPGLQPTTKEISSEPYSLCLCTKFFYNSRVMQVEVCRGWPRHSMVTLPLLLLPSLALQQGWRPIKLHNHFQITVPP